MIKPISPGKTKNMNIFEKTHIPNMRILGSRSLSLSRQIRFCAISGKMVWLKDLARRNVFLNRNAIQCWRFYSTFFASKKPQKVHEKTLRKLRIHLDRANTFRCPCEDQISSFQGENLGDLHDQLRYLENHVLNKQPSQAVKKRVACVQHI